MDGVSLPLEASGQTECLLADGTAVVLRDARSADLAMLLEIYNHEVNNGVATLDLHPKSMEDWELWFDAHSTPLHPLIVADVAGTAVGYACLSPFRHKDAYLSTVELSIYLHPQWRRRGIAGLLMREILDRAESNPDIHLIVSVITDRNEPSERLHRRFGFKHAGNIEEVAYKAGRYHTICMFTRSAEKSGEERA